MTSALLTLVIFGVGVLLFTRFAPQFGKAPFGEHLRKIKKSPQYNTTHFENHPEVHLQIKPVGFFKIIKEHIKNRGKRRPHDKLPSSPLQTKQHDGPHLTWFGHSTFLYEVQNKNILFDPMLGKYASPIPGIVKRYDYDLPATAEELPALDVVIISHDHYDHLDYGTVKKIIPKTKQFFCPLGVGSHLQHWGVPKENIVEFDWWDEVKVDDVTITATPSQHFSGRSFHDKQKTLWAAWAIKSHNAHVLFGGDSGYCNKIFKDIGKKLGPFDLTLLDSAQYHDLWSIVHMRPEESIKAHKELKGKVFMPIHWSGFTLSLHPWTEPVERALKAATEEGVEVITPMIGERFDVRIDRPKKEWWRSIA